MSGIIHRSLTANLTEILDNQIRKFLSKSRNKSFFMTSLDKTVVLAVEHDMAQNRPQPTDNTTSCTSDQTDIYQRSSREGMIFPYGSVIRS